MDEAATCKDFLQVQIEGGRQVQRSRKFYNLDAIISVGYRIKSHVATRFRHWAAHGHTAAEIIVARADAQQPNIKIFLR